MENFIKADTVKSKNDTINNMKVERFITKFNVTIRHGGNESGDGSYNLNDTLDKIPTLNDNEFDLTIGLALQQGWVLTRFDDKHHSVTYKMVKR